MTIVIASNPSTPLLRPYLMLCLINKQLKIILDMFLSFIQNSILHVNHSVKQNTHWLTQEKGILNWIHVKKQQHHNKKFFVK